VVGGLFKGFKGDCDSEFQSDVIPLKIKRFLPLGRAKRQKRGLDTVRSQRADFFDDFGSRN
jgi:hypothetical protein